MASLASGAGRIATAFLVLTAVDASAARAQSRDADIVRCLDLIASWERVACYDRIAQALSARGIGTGGAREAAPALRPDQPGSGASAAARPRPGGDAGDYGAQSGWRPIESGAGTLSARIAEVRTDGVGNAVVTLENGQVWRQKGARRVFMSEGQKIDIRPNPYGQSYLLTLADGGGQIEVERIE